MNMPYKNLYNICPKCKGKKWYSAKLCRKCQPPTNKGKGWSTVIEGRTGKLNKVICRTCLKLTSSKPLENCTEGHINSYERFRKHVKKGQDNMRLFVLNYYGNKCVCCGYSDLTKRVHERSFLEIDHIGGKGRKHFINSGKRNMIMWLYHKIKLENKPPKGFRILCRACNVSMIPNETICEYHKWYGKTLS